MVLPWPVMSGTQCFLFADTVLPGQNNDTAALPEDGVSGALSTAERCPTCPLIPLHPARSPPQPTAIPRNPRSIKRLKHSGQRGRLLIKFKQNKTVCQITTGDLIPPLQ